MSFEIMQAEKLTVNPEYSRYAYELFPLTAEEYNSLKADIVSSKIQNPLSINNAGVILDGHHRYRIATELGIKELPVLVIEFANPLDELYFVVNINTLRRQLNDYQKASIGYELEKIESQRTRQRQLSNLRNNADKPKSLLPLSLSPNGH
jgi:ParB-like chromosome segregation protein Spo0J